MMDKAILDFPTQFNFKPEIQNGDKLQSYKKFVVCAMGGSNHATDILRAWKTNIVVLVHRDYGVPNLQDTNERLIIACSYSGNTEETIDAFQTALKRNLPVAVVTKGGKLLELAREAGAPYIMIPDSDIQPRSAIGFMFMSLLKLMGSESDLSEAFKLADTLHPQDLLETGRALAQKFVGKAPLIYASARNFAVANNWKIKMNENAKVPAFANVLPELNHNEMNGFDGGETTKQLIKNFYVIMLKDADDDPRILKRFDILCNLYEARGLAVEMVDCVGSTRLEKMFSSLILADWVSYFLAQNYGIDPEPVPMVEEFKKLMK